MFSFSEISKKFKALKHYILDMDSAMIKGIWKYDCYDKSNGSNFEKFQDYDKSNGFNFEKFIATRKETDQVLKNLSLR